MPETASKRRALGLKLRADHVVMTTRVKMSSVERRVAAAVSVRRWRSRLGDDVIDARMINNWGGGSTLRRWHGSAAAAKLN